MQLLFDAYNKIASEIENIAKTDKLDLKQNDQQFELTALFFAIERVNLSIIRNFFYLKMNVNVKNNMNQYSLHRTVRQNHENVI